MNLLLDETGKGTRNLRRESDIQWCVGSVGCSNEFTSVERKTSGDQLELVLS